MRGVCLLVTLLMACALVVISKRAATQGVHPKKEAKESGKQAKVKLDGSKEKAGKQLPTTSKCDDNPETPACIGTNGGGRDKNSSEGAQVKEPANNSIEISGEEKEPLQNIEGEFFGNDKNCRKGGKVHGCKKGAKANNKTLITDSKSRCSLQKPLKPPRVFLDSMITNKKKYYQCSFLNTKQSQRTCYLDHRLLCDGTSACADDECGCETGGGGGGPGGGPGGGGGGPGGGGGGPGGGGGSDVFYCSDGQGCIVMQQVCDGYPDCLDASDECVCEDYLGCETNRPYSLCKGLEIRSETCARSNTLQGSIMTSTSSIASLGLFHCISSIVKKINAVDINRLRPKYGKDRKSADPSNNRQPGMMCKRICEPIENHCEYIDWDNMVVDPETLAISVNYSCSENTSIPLSDDLDVCDGFYDCSNKADEAFCATRFYCSDGSKSLPLSKVCDTLPDCADLSDECQNCARNNLADDKHVISNNYLNYYMVLLCLLIMIFNLRGIYGHAARLHNVRRYFSKVNSVLCLQLCIYDCLMGIYIFIITFKNFQYYGSYCLHDAKWRSSAVCNFSGFIFTFSSHGSLMTVLIMGAIRCYNCENMLAYFSLKRVLMGLTAANLLNALCSAVVLFPLEYLENIFVTTVFFKDNQLLKKGTKTVIDALLLEYYGPGLTYEKQSWSARFNLLSNITSNPDTFQPTLKFGFFNQSPLCIQNLFSKDVDDEIKLLKLLYMSFLGVVILSFSVCYIWIALIRFRSAVPTANPTLRQKKARENSKLSKKVTLIISSQLLAWIPIIIATILTLCDKDVSPDFYEVAAIVLIPANSLLNPLFHSPRDVFRKSNISPQRSVATRLSTLRNMDSPLPLTLQKADTSPKANMTMKKTGDIVIEDIADDPDKILVGIDIK